jgi:methionyl-tRNA synthetase
LANGLGNLVSRTLTMINQYRDGRVPAQAGVDLRPTIERIKDLYDAFDFSRALEEIWSLIGWVDVYIVQQQPWKLAKSGAEGDQEKLDRVLYTTAEHLRVITALIAPVLPQTAAKVWRMLGMEQPIGGVRFETLASTKLSAGQKVEPVAPLFPRVDAKPAIERMQELEQKETLRQAALTGKKVDLAPLAEQITIDDFVKVDLRVGEIKFAELVKGADKLLHMKIDIGEPEPRTIVAGIAKAYTPEQLVGRKVVIVANLAPRKLRGIESRGMIVAASLDDSSPVLAGFLEDVPVGARLK